MVYSDVTKSRQNTATLLHTARLEEVLVKLFGNISLRPGNKPCVHQKCCVRESTSQDLEDTRASNVPAITYPRSVGAILVVHASDM